MVFVFASIAMVNANISVKIEDYNNYSELDNTESTLQVDDCFQDAWDYGTENGYGDSDMEYEAMLFFYELMCE